MDSSPLSGTRHHTGRITVLSANNSARPSSFFGSKPVWYGIWGAMALLAGAGTLIAANGTSHLKAELLKYFFFAATLFGAIAAGQLVHGVDFLTRKQRVLAITLLVLYGMGQLVQWSSQAPSLRQKSSRVPSLRKTDFGSYYQTGMQVAHGHPENIYPLPTYPDGRARVDELPFLYPPLFALIMKPFTHLSLGEAFFVWNLASAVLTFTACLLALDLGGEEVTPELALFVVVGMFSFYPVIFCFTYGQVGGEILFLWTASVWLLARGRPLSSALCFALATIIKLTPLVAVPLLFFHRKWKWLAAYGCWLLTLAVISVWQMGWNANLQFFRKVLPAISCGAPSAQNASLVSFIQECFLGSVPNSGRMLTAPHVACLVPKAITLLIYAVLLVRFYRYRNNGNLAWHLSLIMLLSLAISPISWWHHYALALLPMIYMFAWMQARENDILLLCTVLIVGTNIVGFAILLAPVFLIKVALAALVPCLMIAFVYLRIPAPRANA